MSLQRALPSTTMDATTAGSFTEVAIPIAYSNHYRCNQRTTQGA
jgi:hypothetical protein